MTPTADLMKLVEKLPDFATLDAVDDDAHSGRRPCPLENFTIADVRLLRAALTASCDARVGDISWLKRLHRFANRLESIGQVELANELDDIIEDMPTTPAQPKASEGKAGGEAVAFAIQGPDGSIGALGWMPMRHHDALQNLCVLTQGARFVYAYATLTAPGADDGQ